MKDKLRIIKIGGKIISDSGIKAKFLDYFSTIKGKKILVHGGGEQANELSNKFGIKPTIIDGRRVTTKEELEIVTMVYAGSVNKSLIAELQDRGINGLGLSGADINCIVSEKRSVSDIDYGFVGDIKSIDTEILTSLIHYKVVPVFCALTHDGKGNLLNTNADTIASKLSIAFSEEFDTELVYYFDKPGVLLDQDNDSTAMSTLDSATYEQMRTNHKINGGMLPKLDNSFLALKGNVKKVLVGGYSSISNNDLSFTEIKL